MFLIFSKKLAIYTGYRPYEKYLPAIIVMPLEAVILGGFSHLPVVDEAHLHLTRVFMILGQFICGLNGLLFSLGSKRKRKTATNSGKGNVSNKVTRLITQAVNCVIQVSEQSLSRTFCQGFELGLQQVVIF